MSLHGMWALWAVFAVMARERGFAHAYGWFYTSVNLTFQLNLALARGEDHGLDIRYVE